MSMTTHIKVSGINDITILREGLQEMGIDTVISGNTSQSIRGRKVELTAIIQDSKINFTRGAQGDYQFVVNDRNRGVINENHFANKLKQYCTVARVKRKAKEMRYNFAGTEVLEDGSIKITCRSWGMTG